MRIIYLLFIIIIFRYSKGYGQVPVLRQVILSYLTNNVTLVWTIVAGSTNYAYSISTDGGETFGAWVLTGNVNNFIHTFPPPVVNNMTTYSFRVRALDALGTWSVPSNIKATYFNLVWPVINGGEQIGVLNDYMQPIDGDGAGVGGPPYFHEGVDINGAPLTNGENAVAPISELITGTGCEASSGTTNFFINVQINENGVNKFYQLNHLQSIPLTILANQSIATRKEFHSTVMSIEAHSGYGNPLNAIEQTLVHELGYDFQLIPGSPAHVHSLVRVATNHIGTEPCEMQYAGFDDTGDVEFDKICIDLIRNEVNPR